MGAYLINGPSTSGKSTIGKELKRMGFTVIDTDKAFGYHANIETGEPVKFPDFESLTEDWYYINGWIWNRKKIRKALNNIRGLVFFCGGAVNENEFYDCFNKIFCLYVDQKIITSRLTARGNNSFTNNPHFLKKMQHYFGDNGRYINKLTNMVVIDTSQYTIKASVDLIINGIDNAEINSFHMVINKINYIVYNIMKNIYCKLSSLLRI